MTFQVAKAIIKMKKEDEISNKTFLPLYSQIKKDSIFLFTILISVPKRPSCHSLLVLHCNFQLLTTNTKFSSYSLKPGICSLPSA